jgi:tetratricopeptide (TPR) repeat protein
MRTAWSEEDVYLVAERAHELYLQGRHREACVIFEGLVTVDPANAYCRDALGAVYMALGEPERALEELDLLLASYAGHADARARRCEILCRMGRTAEARREVARLASAGAFTHVPRLRLMLEAAGGAPRIENGTQH